MQTAEALRSLCLFEVFAAASSGCDQLAPDRDFEALKNSLELRINDATRGRFGETTDVHFTITNQGTTTARACLGPSRGVSYKNELSGGGSTGSSVNHPGCVREFAIQPGGVMTWTEPLDIPAGRVEVEIAVEIVNPRRCDSFGCASINLTSNKFEMR